MVRLAHCADGNPQNVSAALGGRRKQVGVPRVLEGKLRLHAELNGDGAPPSSDLLMAAEFCPYVASGAHK